MAELTYDNATHKLRCAHAIGAHRMTYYMRCHILKYMPDGKRAKVLVFGERYWADRHHKKRVRYVDVTRLIPITPDQEENNRE